MAMSVTAQLFLRKTQMNEWPGVSGGDSIEWPAKRNKGAGHLSVAITKACVVALEQNITKIEQLAKPGRVRMESKSQSTPGSVHVNILYDDKFYTEHGSVTYDIPLLVLCDAIAFPDQYPDLLDALAEAQGIWSSHDEVMCKKVLGHLSDELYYAMRYGGSAEPLPVNDLLTGDDIIQRSGDCPNYQPIKELDVKAIVDSNALKVIRQPQPQPIIKPDPQPAATAPTMPLFSMPNVVTTFKGPQLDELVQDIALGWNVILIGPTATGKSLCVHDAVAKTGKNAFIIEGHDSLKEYDLLGCFVPDGSQGQSANGSMQVKWEDGIVPRSMKAGGLLFVDEANRMPTRTLNVLLGVISRRAIVITEHGSEEIQAADGFQVIMAMNLGQGYSVNNIDRALINRFEAILEYTYLPAKDERELLVSQTGISQQIAEIMVKIAGETRAKRKTKELSSELTPRSLRAWAIKYTQRSGRKDGWPSLNALKEAAKITWIPQVVGTDADGYVKTDVTDQMLTLIETHCPANAKDDTNQATGGVDPIENFRRTHAKVTGKT